VSDLSLQRKANGVDVSIDASELENMSETDLRRKYDAQSKGGAANVPGGGEDFSDVVAKESAKRRKMDAERAARKGRDGRDFKF
jgi:splicing factor 3B subunit 2